MFCFVDSHCHLDQLQLDIDLNRVLLEAIESNVCYLNTISTNLDNMHLIVKIAQKYQSVFATIGVHPCASAVQSLDNLQLILVQFASMDKVIAIGETGLDYHYEQYDKVSQIKCFELHIDVASKMELPLVIHMRDSYNDLISILSSKMSTSKVSGVIHCFAESKQLVSKLLDLGLYISISGIITYKNADLLRESLRYIPNERLLIETDAPYLVPHQMRSNKERINMPKFLKYIAHDIAKLKRISVEELAEITTNNFFTLFKNSKNYILNNGIV